MVVIWRPFTEAYLWQFWYGQMADADFIRLWRHMHAYFTEGRGLHCLLWEFNGGDRTSGKYPGDDTVDCFASKSTYTPGRLEEDRTGSRPWCQGELGKQEDYAAWVELARAKAPYTTYFLTWDRGFGPMGHPTDGPSREWNPTYAEALRNPWVINRGGIAVRTHPAERG